MSVEETARWWKRIEFLFIIYFEREVLGRAKGFSSAVQALDVEQVMPIYITSSLSGGLIRSEIQDLPIYKNVNPKSQPCLGE
jgi:hypothetical protein